MIAWRPFSAVLPLLAGACSGSQTVTDPASSDAAQVAGLWWGMLAVGSLILLVVCALVAMACSRALRGGEPVPLAESRARQLVVAGGIVVPTLAVLGLVVSGTSVGRIIATHPSEASVTIDVIGHLWWWEIRYRDADGEEVATTANEIHLPVGEPVRFRLHSDNVIHSFWVPNLQGKTDMVPGQINESWLTAREEGVFRGQCAEFCGLQHAHMAFLVVSRPDDAFRDWLSGQAAPAREPETAALEQGREVFASAGCAGCHAIRGTSAVGVLGPDLTHVASRRTLAAGTLRNTPKNLERWIADPGSIKPGVKMPAAELEPERLEALLRYLESLE